MSAIKKGIKKLEKWNSEGKSLINVKKWDFSQGKVPLLE